MAEAWDIFREVLAIGFLILIVIGIFQVVAYIVNRILGKPTKLGPEDEWHHIYSYRPFDDDPTAPDDDEHPVISIQNYRRHRKGIGQ